MRKRYFIVLIPALTGLGANTPAQAQNLDWLNNNVSASPSASPSSGADIAPTPMEYNKDAPARSSGSYTFIPEKSRQPPQAPISNKDEKPRLPIAKKEPPPPPKEIPSGEYRKPPRMHVPGHRPNWGTEPGYEYRDASFELDSRNNAEEFGEHMAKVVQAYSEDGWVIDQTKTTPVITPMDDKGYTITIMDYRFKRARR